MTTSLFQVSKTQKMERRVVRCLSQKSFTLELSIGGSGVPPEEKFLPPLDATKFLVQQELAGHDPVPWRHLVGDEVHTSGDGGDRVDLRF